MKYPVIRNPAYDFLGKSYADCYPNLHKYPATMIPQIGIKLLAELGIQGGRLFDPYCGAGSSFAAGLERDMCEMYGFDINPLAILISKAKFTEISISDVHTYQTQLYTQVNIALQNGYRETIIKPNFTNISYWFSDEVIEKLALIKYCLDQLPSPDIRTLFLVPFSETVRACSYTRGNEFKLYRIPPKALATFQPDVVKIYFQKLIQVIEIYQRHYLPKLGKFTLELDYQNLKIKHNYYDVILTSPPYGDSRTTVAYGQFSLFTNEWLGIRNARKIDALLMGGQSSRTLFTEGVMESAIRYINKASTKRALEVSAFYFDLQKSIQIIAPTLKQGGKAIYIVGNRRVKDVQLPTDQFIAEQLEANGYKHLFTYERQISNKVMPSQNSPSNIKGDTATTMTQEFIVVCEKCTY